MARGALSIALALALVPACSACSAYIAGKSATADGSVMVSHSDDGDGTSDPRIAYVPPATYPPGTMRPIWPDTEAFPRFVGMARGAKTYKKDPGQTPTQPIGHIPQANKTLGYWEANYAIQNECKLMFGESTASSQFKAFALGTPNGTALFSVNELTRIAAERVCTAREAVTLMGALAEAHGFYGADGGAGETLMVGDKEEGFVFHILSDPTGKSAIWVAQRVADDHVSVVANMFTIREVNTSDAFTYLASSNMESVALSEKLWDGVGLLDFTKTYSRGEYAHKYYSGRRMWDGLRRFKPSLSLPGEYGDLRFDKPERPWGKSTYPFSVSPDQKVTPQSWFDAHRSHYEGTPYDTSVGMAAGPFGTPDRYATEDQPGDPGVGSWERTVSIYRTTYTWVVQANGMLPEDVAGTIWWGPADSSKTTFVPLMVSMGEPPKAYATGTPSRLDRGAAYWAHRYVQNLAQIRYDRMIRDIHAVSSSLESKGEAVVASLVSHAKGNGGITPAQIRSALMGHAADVLAATWQLADDLMVRYADGQLTTPQPDGSVECAQLGYPEWWLKSKEVNYTKGPERLGPPA